MPINPQSNLNGLSIGLNQYNNNLKSRKEDYFNMINSIGQFGQNFEQGVLKGRMAQYDNDKSELDELLQQQNQSSQALPESLSDNEQTSVSAPANQASESDVSESENDILSKKNKNPTWQRAIEVLNDPKYSVKELEDKIRVAEVHAKHGHLPGKEIGYLDNPSAKYVFDYKDYPLKIEEPIEELEELEELEESEDENKRINELKRRLRYSPERAYRRAGGNTGYWSPEEQDAFYAKAAAEQQAAQQKYMQELANSNPNEYNIANLIMKPEALNRQEGLSLMESLSQETKIPVANIAISAMDPAKVGEYVSSIQIAAQNPMAQEAKAALNGLSQGNNIFANLRTIAIYSMMTNSNMAQYASDKEYINAEATKLAMNLANPEMVRNIAKRSYSGMKIGALNQMSSSPQYQVTNINGGNFSRAGR
jgi:hypothetical protein